MRHNKIKPIVVLAALFSFAILTLSAKSIEFNGMLRDYLAYTFANSEFAVHEQALDFTLTGWGEHTRLVVNPTVYMSDDKPLTLGIREAYMDFFLENADIRIGKQAIIWGEAEGAFITDLVSPRDMRSFILADFKEIRKGVPAIKVDYYKDAFTFEGIWIPRFVPSTLPDKESMWAKKMPGQLASATVNSPASVEARLENSEVFGKISHFGSKANWALMGGYAYTNEPYISKVTPGPTPVIDQEYGRYIMGGGSLSTTVGSSVLRLEAAGYFDKPFAAVTQGPPPSVVVENHHQVQALAGLDWSLWQAQMSAQYIFGYLFDHNAKLMEQGRPVKEYSNTFTFRVQKTFISDRLTAKLFTYIETDPLNALVRPSLSWSIEDGVVLEGGVDLFVGDEDGTFGYYKENSLAWMAVRWYF